MLWDIVNRVAIQYKEPTYNNSLINSPISDRSKTEDKDMTPSETAIISRLDGNKLRMEEIRRADYHRQPSDLVPEPVTFDLALHLLKQFDIEQLPQPEDISPGADGEICFVWTKAENTLESYIGPGSEIHSFLMGQEKEHSIGRRDLFQVLQRFKSN